MAQAARPLSPHIQIYRWYFTMAMSIAHRTTGIIWTGGVLLFVWWIVALASGPEAFATVVWWFTTWVGWIALFALTFVMMLHTALGVRHLAWDLGYGFEVRTAHRTGRVAVGAAAAATVLVWLVYVLSA